MLTKIRKVYYCEHCGRYKLTVTAMRTHELHCTLNINRKCRLCLPETTPTSYTEMVALIKGKLDEYVKQHTDEDGNLHISSDDQIVEEAWDWLRMNAADCPGCIMTVLRIAGMMWLMHTRQYNWENECLERKAELDAMRADEDREWRGY